MLPGYTLAETVYLGLNDMAGRRHRYILFLGHASDLQQGQQGFPFAHMLLILLGFPCLTRVSDFDM